MLNVAIVGSTGLVGMEIIDVLFEEGLLENIHLTMFASEKSSGKKYFFKGHEYNILELSEKKLKQNFDVVIFSAGETVSKLWVEKFVETGAVVIDNTSAFRKNEKVPLIVPEINFDKLKKADKIISNPNCSTIQLAVVIDKLKQIANVEKVIVSTYQSVSGAGKVALLDYKNKTSNYFKKGIIGNIIPFIGDIDDGGFCTEENKIMFELNKILDSNIKILATTVRVPIERCHGESVYVKFDKKIDLNELKKRLNCEHIVFDELDCFVPTVCSKTNLTYVCRLRQVSDDEIMFFVLADNLRRGAAFNAVLILKKLIEKNLVF